MQKTDKEREYTRPSEAEGADVFEQQAFLEPVRTGRTFLRKAAARETLTAAQTPDVPILLLEAVTRRKLPEKLRSCGRSLHPNHRLLVQTSLTLKQHRHRVSIVISTSAF